MLEKTKERKQELLDLQEMLSDLNDGSADFSNLTAQLDNVIKKSDKSQGRIWHGIEEKRNWEKFDKNIAWKGLRPKAGNWNVSIQIRNRKDRGDRRDVYILHVPAKLKLSERIDLFYSKETNEIGLQFSQNGQYKISQNNTISVTRFVKYFNLPEGEYDSHIEDDFVIGKIPKEKEE